MFFLFSWGGCWQLLESLFVRLRQNRAMLTPAFRESRGAASGLEGGPQPQPTCLLTQIFETI